MTPPFFLKLTLTVVLSLTTSLCDFGFRQPRPAFSENIRFTSPNDPAPSPSRRESSRLRCCPCGCPEKYPTAIVPATYVALTVAEYPAFLLYVPEISAADGCSKGMPTSPPVVELALQDEQDNTVYEKVFSLTGRPGIVRFQVSADAQFPPLEIGKNYHWFLSIICQPQDRSTDFTVDGWIRRVEQTPELTAALSQAKYQDWPAIYAQAGIWHDSAAALVDLRRSQPNDAALAKAWMDLLQSVGLEEFVTEPLVDCCKAEK